MDALMDARTHAESALKAGWQDIQTLAKGYSAMGGDPSTIVPALTGNTRPAVTRSARSTGGGSRSRRPAAARSGARRRSNGNGTGASTPQISEQQFLGYLAEQGGATVTQLAAHFNVSGQTIRRYGKRFATSVDTSSPTWTARETASGG